ncbi:nitroreductase family protein [Agrobacterium larrymoorei]|uniref:Nitroreductase n=1 Tax=Agrobacterium larrymoorei TaxID=160699 RepID=A0A4D7DR15_9HYPH|nr:nitroreductase family protein [Agrobacterium larrymoorei]QCI96646.1 nitroreductase [Agrobacterium larrymoorei]QYA07930.1 nitroreductase family protein [Agrobacterium larrymoorei]
MTTSNSRQSEYPVDPLFLDRWSPRAFDGKPMPIDHLLTILDAAHWAPSGSNQQPWRFVYALNGSAEWDKFVGLLVEGNQRWAKNASALLIILSRSYNVRDGEKKPAPTHSFDAGAAWFSLATQAHLLGYHAHGMAGIFKDKIIEQLNVPEGYAVEAAVAIGTMAHKDTLPDDLAEREVPSKRLPLADVAFEGSFTGKAD